MSKVYWTTKDGREIDIDKMDIDHLRNCLKMVVRNKQEQKEFEDHRDSVPTDFFNGDETYTDYLRMKG